MGKEQKLQYITLFLKKKKRGQGVKKNTKGKIYGKKGPFFAKSRKKMQYPTFTHPCPPNQKEHQPERNMKLLNFL